MKQEDTNWLPIICIGLIAIVFAYIVVNTESTPYTVPASNSAPPCYEFKTFIP